MATKIEWTDRVWNPVVGCTKVSQGCKNCYAERIYERFHPGQKFSVVHTLAGRLHDPLHWRKPRRVFVNSMSDIFHDDVSRYFILNIWQIMFHAPKHTFQILTKRPQRMKDILSEWLPDAWELAFSKDYPGPLPNVWLGVSAEGQTWADERIPLLLETPAAMRFVSCEPLLGPVMLDYFLGDLPEDDDGAPYPGKVDWVIAGGESGPGARPMHPDWVRGIRDQCVGAGVPFFFKGWGEFSWEGGEGRMLCAPIRVGKKAAGRLLDDVEWSEFPSPPAPLPRGEGSR